MEAVMVALSVTMLPEVTVVVLEVTAGRSQFFTAGRVDRDLSSIRPFKPQTPVSESSRLRSVRAG